jgi:hypothetical protein
MARAGFYGMRTEWWHFISKSWKSYAPIAEYPPMTAPPVQQMQKQAPPPQRVAPPPGTRTAGGGGVSHNATRR